MVQFYMELDYTFSEPIFCVVTTPFSFTELDSQGRLIDTDKWDNHNAIARGFSRDNYHPVTFRKIYGVEKQAPTPVPMMRQPTPSSQPPPQQVIPTEEPEAVSDL